MRWYGHQLCFGIAEELLRLSISHGWERGYPDTWLGGSGEHGNQRYEVRYNAQVFAILAEQLLTQAGVTILYGTTVCQMMRRQNKITHLIAENKDGRFAVPVRSAVDATGDADLFQLAGEPTRLYAKGNLPAAWFYETQAGANILRMVGAADVLSDDESAEVPDAIRGSRISGIDANELSHALLSCHAQSLETFLKNGPVSEAHSLSALATIPQLRMTRCICGAYTLDDAEDHRRFEDRIGMTGDWRMRGPAYELPLRTLHTDGLDNCMAAGRIISVTDAMWDTTRVIPTCAVTGQAAGLAMAMTDELSSLRTDELQKLLVTQGVRLHLDEFVK